MQIGLVSYHELSNHSSPDCMRDFQTLLQCALALVQHGLQVFWVSSTDMLEALSHDADLSFTGLDDLPATCRHVIPCHSYRLGGVRLFCVDREIWRQPDLHTRLFTFLLLLHRRLPCRVFHAWGSLSAAYVGTYTASFLGLPAVVSYGRPWLYKGSRETFMWQWVARHVALALVRGHTDREQLLRNSELPRLRVRVTEPSVLTSGVRMSALYQCLEKHGCDVSCS